MEIKNLDKFIFDQALTALDTSFDVKLWAKSVGVDLAENQVEIVETINRPDINNIVVLGSRSMGKTYAVAIASIRACIAMPKYSVLVFGPKQNQAKRIILQIISICRSSFLESEIRWDVSSQQRLVFKNESTIEALSANEKTQNEGWHGDLGIIDECHQVSSEVMAKKISPMFKSSLNPKIVKIGISLYNNHFRESFESAAWTKLVYPWYKCQWLYKGKLINIQGIDYPKTVIDDMPLSYKRERFPNNPEVHYQSVNNMLEEDFDTQYEMVWCDTINKFLRDDDFIRIIGSHSPEASSTNKDTYFFGLDCAGGGKVEKGDTRDFTELTVVKRTVEGIKQVVGVWEWQGDITEQIEEILSIIHPDRGIFKCVRGAADYSTMGSAIVDFIEKSGVKINGIKYKSTEAATGKNYKNAIFDQFLFELRQDKFKYPAKEYIDRSKLFQKHMDEWSVLERRKTNGLNDSISAPVSGSYHDDTCNSAALACWAAERSDVSRTVQFKTYSLPPLVIGTHSSVNRTTGATKNRFL